jgi:hypothetical protein
MVVTRAAQDIAPMRVLRGTGRAGCLHQAKLRTEPAVLNLSMHPGAVSNPDGDAVDFDVLHGAANDVIAMLRDLGLEERGSIVMENVDTAISARADRVMDRQSRFQQFTPVWAEVESRIGLESSFPPSWFVLLVIAGLIGAVGILTNSEILSLIDVPNWFSFIVAVLAGIVGVVSLTEARSSTLMGVFISVTTIPAASDIGVSLAFDSDKEAWGSALQLVLNVTVLAAVAIVGLPLQGKIWRRAGRRAASQLRAGG